METLIKKLKLGILLAGLVILTSCDNTSILVSTAGINAIHHTIPSLAIRATKYSGNKISKYLKNSSPVKKRISTPGKNEQKASRNRKALPISIGVTGGARLVTSADR